MFDVCWVDPTRETIGERRSRKEQTTGAGRHHKKETRTPREGSLRSSISSESTATAKVLQVEVPPSRKSISRWIKAKSHLGLPLHDATTYDEEKLSTDSIRSESPAPRWPTDRDSLEYAHSEAQSYAATEIRRPSMTLGARYVHDPIETDRLSNADSTCSWSSFADSLVPCSRSNSFVVQPLSPGSFVSQSIEVMIGPRDSFHDGKELRTSIISITAAGASSRQEQLSEPEHPQISPRRSPPPSARAPRSLSFSRDSLPKDEPQSTSHGYPRDRPSVTSQTWEAPKAWEYVTRSSESPPPMLTSEAGTKHPTLNNGPPPASNLPLAKRKPSRNTLVFPIEFQHIQRRIRLTETASTEIMLERLREDWSGTMDATLRREPEMHKHMWMVTAMRAFIDLDGCQIRREGLEAGKQRSPRGVKERSTRGELDKVLSLFEGYASAAYLAVTIPSGTEMHQLSTTPLSPDQFPNVMPLSVPTAIPSLAYASNIFSSIHASGLAALFASSAIPKILKECQRVLISPSSRAQTFAFATSGSQQVNDAEQVADMAAGRGGVLHLKIVDPCPVSATLGPRLRDWLDRHLVFDLERQFRCLHPIRLFPSWLVEAGLFAEGSSIARMSFFASNSTSSEPSTPRASRNKDWRGDAEQSAAAGGWEQGVGQGEQSYKDDITQHLKTEVGRILWKEVWGPHVQLKGGKWWWEDNDILHECWSKGTLWEYAIVEAVKG